MFKQKIKKACIYCNSLFMIRETKKQKYCSRKCVDEHKKVLMLKNTNSINQTEEANSRRSLAMKEKWHTEEYKNKRAQSFEKAMIGREYWFGCDPESLKKKKESLKQTCLKKYGVEHNFSNEEVRKKCNETCVKLYGKTSFEMGQEKITQEIYEKRRRTLIETIYNISYEEYEILLPQKVLYYKKVRRITNQQPLEILENYSKQRGRSDIKNKDVYQLDHIIPICFGFINNISPEIIGNISNLRFIPWFENNTKGSKHEEKN